MLLFCVCFQAIYIWSQKSQFKRDVNDVVTHSAQMFCGCKNVLFCVVVTDVYACFTVLSWTLCLELIMCLYLWGISHDFPLAVAWQDGI